MDSKLVFSMLIKQYIVQQYVIKKTIVGGMGDDKRAKIRRGRRTELKELKELKELSPIKSRFFVAAFITDILFYQLCIVACTPISISCQARRG